MVYRPTFRKQLDGTACQGSNCGCASSAMASQRAREGRDPANAYPWPPTPRAIRGYIRSHYGTGCQPTTFGQNERACGVMYRVDLQPRYNIPWATFRSMIISGRGAVAAISYGAIHGTRFDACPSFRGGHSVYVNERKSDGAYLVYDPLADGRRGYTTAPDWWPGSLLQKAMYAYPGTNPGCVHASFTIDTE
jgi:hypothetical protein